MSNNNTIFSSMESLKKEGSIRVYTGMTVVFPHYSKEETLNICELAPKFNGCYAMNNSTVCFVCENEVFVTPYTRAALRTLRSADFREDYFYVPFSNGDYPKSEQLKWYSLRRIVIQCQAEDFIEDCNAYCDSHHIGTISDDTLKNCFEIPSAGVKVKHLNFENFYYPIIKSGIFDCTTGDLLGKYCTNNGRVVFVYRDGKTYVAKGYKILSELRESGYKESGLFVPFSNGEQIVDPNLRAKWESLSKF